MIAVSFKADGADGATPQHATCAAMHIAAAAAAAEKRNHNGSLIISGNTLRTTLHCLSAGVSPVGPRLFAGLLNHFGSILSALQLSGPTLVFSSTSFDPP